MVSASAKSATGLVPKVSCPAWAQGPLCSSRLGSLPQTLASSSRPDLRESPSAETCSFLSAVFSWGVSSANVSLLILHFIFYLDVFKHPETLQNSVMNTHMPWTRAHQFSVITTLFSLRVCVSVCVFWVCDDYRYYNTSPCIGFLYKRDILPSNKRQFPLIPCLTLILVFSLISTPLLSQYILFSCLFNQSPGSSLIQDRFSALFSLMLWRVKASFALTAPVWPGHIFSGRHRWSAAGKCPTRGAQLSSHYLCASLAQG